MVRGLADDNERDWAALASGLSFGRISWRNYALEGYLGPRLEACLRQCKSMQSHAIPRDLDAEISFIQFHQVRIGQDIDSWPVVFTQECILQWNAIGFRRDPITAALPHHPTPVGQLLHLCISLRRTLALDLSGEKQVRWMR